MTFIGGVGTVRGPILGAILYVFLKEYLAVRWVDFHVLVFGGLFIVTVLLLPGGLVQAVERARRLFAPWGAAPRKTNPPAHAATFSKRYSE
jgi:ABC-type branched-subunit amino acid transport system permease subunit